MPNPMSFEISNEEYLDKASSNQLRMLMQHFWGKLEDEYEVEEMQALVPRDPIGTGGGITILGILTYGGSKSRVDGPVVRDIVVKSLGVKSDLTSLEQVDDDTWEICVNIPVKMTISIEELN